MMGDAAPPDLQEVFEENSPVLCLHPPRRMPALPDAPTGSLEASLYNAAS